MIEIRNAELILFKDGITIGKRKVTREELMNLTPEQIGSIPIVFKRGAINYNIGVINKTNVGGNAITGDLLLNLSGKLILEIVDGKVKPTSYQFTVEK